MRPARWLPLLALLVWSPRAALAAGADEALSTSSGPQIPSLPQIGVMVDAGIPDGANASLVFRPYRWLRAHAGGGYNMISPGVRAGISLLPFGSGISGTLEAGHYFEGNANGLAQRFAGSGFQSPVLDRVGYDYANAHLGLDFGSRAMTFYIHGGVSYLRGQIHNLNSAVSSAGGSLITGSNNGSTEITVPEDPTVRVWVPSAKLGLIVYLM